MGQQHEILTKIYNGTLLSRLNFGKKINGALGRQLMQDKAFAESFAALRQCADSLDRHMEKMEMGKLCAACSAENLGGCCSRAIAEETDAIQMLMNMLAGVDVDILSDNDKECCFLGDRGCIFMFKPMFCLNYNCHKIIAATTADKRSDLERFTGQLLCRQYEIEAMLLAKIHLSISPMESSNNHGPS